MIMGKDLPKCSVQVHKRIGGTNRVCLPGKLALGDCGVGQQIVDRIPDACVAYDNRSMDCTSTAQLDALDLRSVNQDLFDVSLWYSLVQRVPKPKPK